MKEYLTNSGDTFYVIEEFIRKVGKKNCKMFLVQYKETGYTRVVYRDNALAGKLKDPYAKTKYGRGYLGEFEKVHYWKQAKQLWSNMMKRCYSTKDLRGYYGRCFVDDRWLGFENFVKDISKLKNFQLWLDGQNGAELKYNLDKDFKVFGNNIYSKHLCMFVEEGINKADGATRGKPYTRKPRVLKQ